MNIELEQVCIDSASFEAGSKVPKDKASSNKDQSLPSASGLSTYPKTGSGTASSKEDERPTKPTWLGDQTFKCGDPYKAPCPQVDGDPWEKVYRTVKEHDETMCNAWMDEIQNLLILAGLFSGIVTAFVIETQKLLQEDPTTTSALFLAHIASQLAANSNSQVPLPSTTLQPLDNKSLAHAFRINALFFLSLVVSLSAALFGILVLQWIRSYRKQETLSYADLLGLRQCRYQGLMTWKVPQIVSALPILLQFGLVVFFAGLVDFLHFLYPKLSIVIGVFVSLVILILVLTTILPSLILLEKCGESNAYSRWLNRCRLCAYQSPQAWVFLQSVFWILQNIIRRLLAWWYSLPFLTCSQYASWYDELEYLRVFGSYDDWTGLVKHQEFSTWTPYALSWVFQANASNTPGSFWAAYHCFKSLRPTEGMMLTLHDLVNSSTSTRISSSGYWIGDQLPSGQILQDLKEIGNTKFTEEFFSSQLFRMGLIDDELGADHRIECLLRCMAEIETNPSLVNFCQYLSLDSLCEDMCLASEIYKQHIWDLQCSVLRSPEIWEYPVEGFPYLFCDIMVSSDWDELTIIRPDEGLFLLYQSLTANNFERQQRVTANVVRSICTSGNTGVSMGRVFDNVHFRACLDFLMSEVGRELEDFAAPGISRLFYRSNWLKAMDKYGVDDKYVGLFGAEDPTL